MLVRGPIQPLCRSSGWLLAPAQGVSDLCLLGSLFGHCVGVLGGQGSMSRLLVFYDYWELLFGHCSGVLGVRVVSDFCLFGTPVLPLCTVLCVNIIPYVSRLY